MAGFKILNYSELDWTKILAAICCGFIGFIVGLISPLVTASLMQRGLSAEAAGGVFTAEIVASGVAQFLTSVLATRYSPRVIGIASALAFIAANLLSCLNCPYLILIIIRATAGFGAGAAGCMVASAASHAKAPERVYSAAIFSVMSIAFVLLFTLPLFTARHGLAAIYFSLAGIATISLVGIRSLPDVVANKSRFAVERAPLRFSYPTIILVLSAVFCYNFANTAYWTFASDLAGAAGLQAEQTGFALSLATGSSMVGSLLVWIVSNRWDQRAILSAGLIADTLCVAVMSITRIPGVFIAATMSQGAATNLHTPYQLKIASALDTSGRWAMTSLGVQTLSSGLAPITMGAIVDRSGLHYIGWSNVILVPISLVLFLFALTRMKTAEVLNSHGIAASNGIIGPLHD